MSETMTDAVQSNDVLADTGGVTLAWSLECMMADSLRHNDRVIINGDMHEFQHKRAGAGPHVFINLRTGFEACFGTQEIFKLQEQKLYRNPGRTGLQFDSAAWTKEALEQIQKSYRSVNKKSRAKAETKMRYVSEFMNRIHTADPEAPYARSHDNATEVIKFVDKEIADENVAIQKHNENLAASGQLEIIVRPRNLSTRSLLRWVKRQIELKMQEAALVHFNAVKARKRRLPQRIFAMISETIREVVEVSHKIGPTKIRILVNGKIKKENDARLADHERQQQNGEIPAGKTPNLLPEVKLTTVQNEYRRYDAWIRLAKAEGVAKADLEFGGVGKVEKPRRILDLVEVDHHQFDFHGILGTTPLGKSWGEAGFDRFWICLGLDVHSGYPVGLFPSFEPGGLHPALMCIDHMIKPKTYVAQRWPDINGSLLGFGKPVKIKYDNGKEFVSNQMKMALARIGVGFQMAIPHQPKTKPHVERFFGTMEEDFVSWLKGYCGNDPKKRGDRNPVLEAIITIEDFMYLLHMWLIEVYARRKQQGLDYDTPEERWMRGATNPDHQPRTLTEDELKVWDLVPTLELKLRATDDGILWKNLCYQSPELQAMRRRSGCYGSRKRGRSLPVTVRIPLYDVGKAYVADPTARETGDSRFPHEIIVEATNKHAHGRSKWQHEVVCGFVRSKKKSPTDHASYEEGFRHLYAVAIQKMRVVAASDKPPSEADLTGAQAPRMAGVLAYGAEKHALAALEATADRLGMFATKGVPPVTGEAPQPIRKGTGDDPLQKKPVRRAKIRYGVHGALDLNEFGELLPRKVAEEIIND
jgi:putative transposase